MSDLIENNVIHSCESPEALSVRQEMTAALEAKDKEIERLTSENASLESMVGEWLQDGLRSRVDKLQAVYDAAENYRPGSERRLREMKESVRQYEALAVEDKT